MDRTAVGFRSERGRILVALMMSSALIALDTTVIATAVPAIVSDLGGFASFPWLFSSYLLMQAITIPLGGRLADMIGRRPVLLCGIAVFLAASVLCAAAWSMGVLIAGRALQGLGAGAIQPMNITVAGDLYTLEERARVQGYLASVWGMASVAGPVLGGALSAYTSWRWIFVVNVPLCVVAAWLIVRHLAEPGSRRPTRIDWSGTALFAAGWCLLLLGVLEGGHAWSWQSWQSLVALAGGALLVAAFVAVERRAPEPMVPLWLFRRRVLVACSLVGFGVGGVVIGLSAYVPNFAQRVLGAGPVVAGFALATLLLGWPVAASQSGRLYLRWGFGATALAGGGLVVTGALVLVPVGAGSSLLHVAVGCFVVGLGLGLVATPTVIAAQVSVSRAQRGTVTANNLFARALGSATGAAALGAVANATGGSDGTVAGLAHATRLVLAGVCGFAVLVLVSACWIPHRLDEVSGGGTRMPRS